MDVGAIASANAAKPVQEGAQQAQQAQQAADAAQQTQKTAEADNAKAAEPAKAGEAGQRFEVVLSAVKDIETRAADATKLDVGQVFDKLGVADRAVGDMKKGLLDGLTDKSFMEPYNAVKEQARQVRSEAVTRPVESEMERNMMKMRAEATISTEYMNASTVANARIAQANNQFTLAMAGMSFFKEVVNTGVKSINKLISAR